MTTASEHPAQPDSRRRWFAGLAALGGIGLLVGPAEAQGWRRGALDPEEMARRLDWRIGRLVASLGGTPEQKDRLVAIAQAARADLQPIREQIRQTRRAGLDLLAAPVIDKRAVEQLRVTRMQLADARSKRRMQAWIDSAEVLTPEQRTQLAERWKQRMGRRAHG
jgi:Spy/CpxP family protein refolding chaperone